MSDPVAVPSRQALGNDSRGATSAAPVFSDRGGLSPAELVRKVVRRLRESAGAALFLRACTRVGAGARVIGRPVIVNRGRIVIGTGLRMSSRWNPIAVTAATPDASVELGDDVGINYGAFIFARRSVRIGHRAQIGNLCIISDTELPATHAGADTVAPAQPIEIGDDVWLAVRVTVMPGARIGDGAVITAGSVVSGQIPRRVVAGGNPARVIRALDVADEPERAAPVAPVAHTLVPAAPATVDHRGLLVADFTVDELSHLLRRSTDRPHLEATVAPFGNVTQTLLTPAPAAARDFLVVWTRPETAIAAFGRLMASEAVPLAEMLTDVDTFCDLVLRAAAEYRFVFVPTWTMPAWQRGLGLLDGEKGILRSLTAMNLRLMERLSGQGKVHVLDAQRWITRAGTAAYSPKPWYLGKLTFPTEVLEEAARDLQAAIGALTGAARKVVVVDLDDTMWGGTVGEQGWQNLVLGGHDPQGEGFADFQRGLKALRRRGVILAIASKNDEAVALEAIDQHPEMLLRRGDFVGWRINWRDKAQNVADLATALNLGLQSFVFIDNDPVERARVREALPEVLVPEWPADPMFYYSALQGLRCFDVPALTESDANRSELYAAEQERERFKTEVGSIEDWLKSLQMHVRVERLSRTNLTRAAQLFNKTNQMNLSTRRLTADELLAWSDADDRRLWTFTVSDRFGDAGLTGLLSVEPAPGGGRIVDFILSCRVMGRKVENTMLHVAVAHARAAGWARLEAEYLPTAKNKPCLEFWKRSGFAAESETRFTWNPAQAYALPDEIQLEGER